MMKFFTATLFFILISALVSAQPCPPADTTVVVPVQDYWEIPYQNTWNGLEIMTWNLETFPRSSSTVNYVSEIIGDMLPDVIVFQEIIDLDDFNSLAENLPAYDFINTDYIGMGSFTNLDLGMAVRNDCLEILESDILFQDDEWEFAYRPPLSARLRWQCGGNEDEFRIINVHFKCCSDGFARRRLSSAIIRDYIHDAVDSGEETRIIVAGDFNDDIDEPENDNSLWPLVNDGEYCTFTTMPIVGDDSQLSYPWGGYNSFLDHILISSGYFAANQNADVHTMRLDDWLGDNAYQSHVSDHRPVIWSIPISSSDIPTGLVINEIMNNPSAVSDTYGEWFELTNTGSEIIDLNGLIIRDGDSDQHFISHPEPLLLPSGEFLVLGRSADIELNGGVTPNYVYTGINLNNTWDELILVHPSGVVLDEIAYDNGASFPDPSGASMMLTDPALDNSIGAHWTVSTEPFGAGDLGTPGAENTAGCAHSGDVNGDSMTDVIDLVLIVSHILGELEFTDEEFCEADRNADGWVDVVDLVLLVEDILQ